MFLAEHIIMLNVLMAVRFGLQIKGHDGSMNGSMTMKMMKDESYHTLLRQFGLVFHQIRCKLCSLCSSVR